MIGTTLTKSRFYSKARNLIIVIYLNKKKLTQKTEYWIYVMYEINGEEKQAYVDCQESKNEAMKRFSIFIKQEQTTQKTVGKTIKMFIPLKIYSGITR